MVINFGKPEIKIEHGKWGIGDMNVHFYVSPAISEEHKKAVQEAVDEFFRLFPDKKDWFKIQDMQYPKKVADIVKNQPATIKEITDLHFHYYWNKFDEIYKDNKSPLTTILVIPYIFGSGNNGTGTRQHFSTIVLDLQNKEHLKSTVKHELGHRFGVDEHCTGDHCIMNASGVGTHFCPKCMQIMKLRIALMFMNSRPYTFGTPNKEQKNSFVFGEPIKR